MEIDTGPILYGLLGVLLMLIVALLRARSEDVRAERDAAQTAGTGGYAGTEGQGDPVRPFDPLKHGGAAFKIEVFRCGEFYVARYDDPAVIEAFGQDTLPTAFTADADPGEVLRYISGKNPEHEVILIPTEGSKRWPAMERCN